MKHRSRANSSSLFLLELILSILFFSIASAVCVQLFVKSHILSTNARELNRSVIEVSSIAELTNTAQDTDSAIQEILSLYPNSEKIEDSQIQIYYNHDFDPCSETDFTYVLDVQFVQDESTLSTILTMMDPDKNRSIYHLDVIHHIARRN